jgi:hypothetical protein
MVVIAKANQVRGNGRCYSSRRQSRFSTPAPPSSHALQKRGFLPERHLNFFRPERSARMLLGRAESWLAPIGGGHLVLTPSTQLQDV